MLTRIRERLAHDPDEERAVSADELRRLARSRVARLVDEEGSRPSAHPADRPANRPAAHQPEPPAPRVSQESGDYGRPDSPSVAV